MGSASVDVTIVDQRNHHLFQPLLYQVATAALSPADIAAPIRTILAGNRNREGGGATERRAAELWESASILEPTRSVLYRSAASLAVDCQDYAEARRLIDKGLSGEPPEDIRQELLDLLTRIEPPRRAERRLSSGKR